MRITVGEWVRGWWMKDWRRERINDGERN